MEELARPGGPYTQLVLPGGAVVRRGDDTAAADAAVAAAPWHRFQMPAYNLHARPTARAASPSSTSASVRPTPRP